MNLVMERPVATMKEPVNYFRLARNIQTLLGRVGASISELESHILDCGGRPFFYHLLKTRGANERELTAVASFFSINVAQLCGDISKLQSVAVCRPFRTDVVWEELSIRKKWVIVGGVKYSLNDSSHDSIKGNVTRFLSKIKDAQGIPWSAFLEQFGEWKCDETTIYNRQFGFDQARAEHWAKALGVSVYQLLTDKM